MSFSSEVKEELKTKTDTAKHCQIAEFAIHDGVWRTYTYRHK